MKFKTFNAEFTQIVYKREKGTVMYLRFCCFNSKAWSLLKLGKLNLHPEEYVELELKKLEVVMLELKRQTI